MGHFSNGSEGVDYQARYCDGCVHWSDDVGCPVWHLHEMHNGEKGWTATLNKLIPIEDKVFNGKCVTFREREHAATCEREQYGQPAGCSCRGVKEPPLRPTQIAALREWKPDLFPTQEKARR